MIRSCAAASDSSLSSPRDDGRSFLPPAGFINPSQRADEGRRVKDFLSALSRMGILLYGMSRDVTACRGRPTCAWMRRCFRPETLHDPRLILAVMPSSPRRFQERGRCRSTCGRGRSTTARRRRARRSCRRLKAASFADYPAADLRRWAAGADALLAILFEALAIIT